MKYRWHLWHEYSVIISYVKARHRTELINNKYNGNKMLTLIRHRPRKIYGIGVPKHKFCLYCFHIPRRWRINHRRAWIDVFPTRISTDFMLSLALFQYLLYQSAGIIGISHMPQLKWELKTASMIIVRMSHDSGRYILSHADMKGEICIWWSSTILYWKPSAVPWLAQAFPAMVLNKITSPNSWKNFEML